VKSRISGKDAACAASPCPSNSLRSLAAMSWQRPNIGSPPLPTGSAAPVHSQRARLGAAAGAKCHCVCQVGTSKQGHSSRNRLGSFCQNLTLRLYLAKPHPTIGMARRRARRSNWKFGFILPFCQKHVSDCILSDCILVSLQLDGRLVNGRLGGAQAPVGLFGRRAELASAPLSDCPPVAGVSWRGSLRGRLRKSGQRHGELRRGFEDHL
jgi:hypothetical protein